MKYGHKIGQTSRTNSVSMIQVVIIDLTNSGG